MAENQENQNLTSSQQESMEEQKQMDQYQQMNQDQIYQNTETATVRNKLSGAEYEVQGASAIERLRSDENIEFVNESNANQGSQTMDQTTSENTQASTSGTDMTTEFGQEFAGDNPQAFSTEFGAEEPGFENQPSKKSRKSKSQSENQQSPTE